MEGDEVVGKGNFRQPDQPKHGSGGRSEGLGEKSAFCTCYAAYISGSTFLVQTQTWAEPD